jgi:hypothetical protein
MKNVFILVCLLIMVVFTLNAQSNAFLDSYFASDQANIGESAYLVLTLSGIIPETSTVDAALDEIKTKGWNIAFKDKTQAITLGEFAYLVMKANNLSGGLMYALFPGPRYAGRELVYEGIVKGDPNPGRALSGREAFAILRLVLDSREKI